jgi:dolichol-phosphate mannosyltransferase
MVKALVVIPTYNERENIQNIIMAINAVLSLDILVVDDRSPDGTAEIVEKMQLEYKNLYLIKREKPRCFGGSYIDGFRYAIKNEYDYAIQMDADFSHNPKYIPQLLAKAQDNDVVIGSRYIQGGGVENWPLHRFLLSYGASKYVWLITGLPVKDPTAGFKCISCEALKKLDLDNIKSNGYSFQIETIYKLWKKGANVAEVPIIFVDRKKGETKMNAKIVFEAIFIVWKFKRKFLFF